MNCKSNKTDCAAYVNNGCAALQKHAERNNGKCPFYRSKTDESRCRLLRKFDKTRKTAFD